jgi:hypothetical protein
MEINPMVKVVINRCYGGFGLSDEAVLRYAEIKGINLVRSEKYEWFSSWYVDGIEDDNHLFVLDDFLDARTDPTLVQVVEELGRRANSNASDLAVVEIPDGVEWHIAEHDGLEHVAENHRTWYG